MTSTTITEYTLRNPNGSEVVILDYGGYIRSFKVPNRDGDLVDIVLGYEKVEDYLTDDFYLGCTIGRVANRIAKGEFILDGVTYKLDTNNGPNHLHGGLTHFGTKFWNAKQLSSTSLELTTTSPDGENGYPGNLNVKVTYTLSESNSLRIDYHATTDKKTLCMLTNHAYFNLSGAGQPTITDHKIVVNARKYLPTDEDNLTLGVKKAVSGKFDLREPGINFPDNSTYDGAFVVDGRGLREAARITSQTTGLQLRVVTDQPCMHLYSAFWLNPKGLGKEGVAYTKNMAFCCETHAYPNAVNVSNFPNDGFILDVGEVYKHTCIYEIDQM